jgi:hypothetical protein
MPAHMGQLTNKDRDDLKGRLDPLFKKPVVWIEGWVAYCLCGLRVTERSAA